MEIQGPQLCCKLRTWRRGMTAAFVAQDVEGEDDFALLEPEMLSQVPMLASWQIPRYRSNPLSGALCARSTVLSRNSAA